MKKLLTLAAAALAALSVAAGTASADSSPYGGALNMVFDPSMGYTMANHTSANGNNGMYCAVFVTSGSYAPGTCNGTTPLP